VSSARIHLALTVMWSGLAIPTVIWWRQSILWVAFMSLYANIASHAAAWEAAKAKQAIQKED
jgi:hypothetical protein